MAVKTWLGSISSSWGASANWSGPTTAIPTAADDLIFGATSPNCDVDIASPVCRSIDFTSYGATVTMTNGITIGQTASVTTGATSGFLYLGASMGISGPGGITLRAVATNNRFDLRSNGRVWPNNFTASWGIVSQTPFHNFLDNWVIGGTFTIGNPNNSSNVTSLNITCLGNFRTQAAASGAVTANTSTTKVILGGTCTWSASPSAVNGVQQHRTNISIDIDSGPSTVTIADGTSWGGAGSTASLLRYVSGTVVHPIGATFFIQSNSVTTCSIDLNGSTSPGATSTSSTGVNFENVQVRTGATNTLRTADLVSPLRILKNFSTSNTTGGGQKTQAITFNGSSINIDGNLTHAGGSIRGTTTVNLIGTGTWTEPGAVNTMGIYCPVVINTAGTLTIQGTVYVGGGTLGGITYTAGTVVAAGATIGITPSNASQTLSGCSNFEIGGLVVNGSNQTLYRVVLNDTQNLTIGTVTLDALNSTNRASFNTSTVGFTCSYFNFIVPSTSVGDKVIDLAPTKYYYVKKGLVIRGAYTAAGAPITAVLRATASIVKSYLIVSPGASTDLYLAIPQRIDASGGKPLHFRLGSIAPITGSAYTVDGLRIRSTSALDSPNCFWMTPFESNKFYITE